MVTKRHRVSGAETLRKKKEKEKKKNNLLPLRVSSDQGFFEQEGEVGGRGGGGVGVGAERGRREGRSGRQIRNRSGSVGSNPDSARAAQLAEDLVCVAP